MQNNIKLNQNQLTKLTNVIKSIYEDFIEFKTYINTSEFINAFSSKEVEEKINEGYEHYKKNLKSEKYDKINEYFYNLMKDCKADKFFIKKLLEITEREQTRLLTNLRFYNSNMNINQQLHDITFHLLDIKMLVQFTEDYYINNKIEFYEHIENWIENISGNAKYAFLNMYIL